MGEGEGGMEAGGVGWAGGGGGEEERQIIYLIPIATLSPTE